ASLQLDMDLQSDHRLVLDGGHSAPLCPWLPSNPIRRSSGNAASTIAPSPNAGATSWKPTGRPSVTPQGMEIAGIPARDIGIVNRSFMYMASGSSVLAPSSNAGVGLVGVTTKSNSEKTSLKS